MSKTEIVRARVEPRLKRDAEAVLKKVGLTPSEAINLFLTQVTLSRGLPFPVRIPNKRTARAIREAQADKGMETFDTVDEWTKEMRSHLGRDA